MTGRHSGAPDKDISPELLQPVYRELCEQLGMDTAMALYRLFRGQQITFPMRFLDAACVRARIQGEYDGANLKALALKYGYSEKTIRRMLREQ